MEKEIVQYVREGRKPIGVVVAMVSEEGYRIGWSLCHPEDMWDREYGRFVAEKRAESKKSMDSLINCITRCKAKKPHIVKVFPVYFRVKRRMEKLLEKPIGETTSGDNILKFVKRS